MKHSVNITLFLLGMFFITQLLGLVVINAYSPKLEQITNSTTGVVENITFYPNELPYGMQPPEMEPEISIFSIIISIIIATALIFLIRRLKMPSLLRIWFFSVVAISIGITLTALLMKFISGSALEITALVIAVPLAFFKIFRRNIIVHNLTEIMVYPGIAAVFVPILNIPSMIVLLVLIAIYDVYAVWHSKFMQNMAKFQINQLKVFTGFFIPYIAKKDRIKIQKIKSLKLDEKKKTQKLKKLKIKVNLAILGGGDITFPLICAGIILRAYGLIPALIISFVSTIALGLLFFLAKKGKFYPAMVFLSPACIIGWLLGLPFRSF